MELRDYLAVFRRRWAFIIATVLVAVGLAGVLTLAVTPQYTATSRLFISSVNADSEAAYQGGLFSQERVLSYADLITGQTMAQRVIDDLGLRTTPRELSSQFSASVVSDTVILEVSTTDASPARARVLTQALAEEFVDYVPVLESGRSRLRSPVTATIVDPATLPVSPTTPRPLRNLGLAAILGLLFGAGVSVLQQIIDTTVKRADALEEATDAPVLGTIPYDPKAQRQPLITGLHSHAPRVEAFRTLRTNLAFTGIDRQSHVLVMTSALPQEGKSSSAVNLALSMNQAGQRVLLIEADLRRPKISEYANIEHAVGLTTVLLGDVDLDEAIQHYSEDLHILASGALPPNPAELLQSASMGEVLRRLRSEYSMIVIDAPPLLPVTDAAILTSQADGAMLVVCYGKTTSEQVKLAQQRLRAVDGVLLGSILCMTPQKASGRYSYEYGYGYAPETGLPRGLPGSRVFSRRRR